MALLQQTNNLQNNYAAILNDVGTVMIPACDLPWTLQELHAIKEMTHKTKLPYQRASYGDTGEENPVFYFRMRHPRLNETSLEACMTLLETDHVYDFLLNLTGLEDYTIDRCQVHWYEKNCKIARHRDSDSEPSYAYSAVILLSQDYEGGEFLVYPSDHPDEIFTLKPPQFSMIVSRCTDPHEVRTIESGVRHNLVFFLKPTL